MISRCDIFDVLQHEFDINHVNSGVGDWRLPCVVMGAARAALSNHWLG